MPQPQPPTAPDHRRWSYRPGYLDNCTCVPCKARRAAKAKS